MKKQLTFRQEGDGFYYVECGNAMLGTLYREVDGYLGFQANGATGYWPAHLMREIADKLDELNKPWDQQVYRDLCKKRSITSAERASQKEKMDKKVQDWCRQNLKPGMRLKVGGCRDGKGLRIVLTYTPGNRGPGYMDIVECRQIYPSYKFCGRTTEESLGQITEHMVNKIQKVLQPNGTWVSLRKLLK